MSNSNVVTESSGTSNSSPSETISAAAADNDQLDIPPAKRPHKEDSLTDKFSFEYQHLAWGALKQSINDLVEQVNASNLPTIIRQILQHNIIRGRGILANSIIEAQFASPNNTNLYAALVSVVNTKFPQISLLICKRVIHSYREYFVADERKKTFIAIKFIAHLVNQKILHEKIAFEILDVLLRNISSDSVKLAIYFLQECGQKLLQVNPHELDCQFSKLNDLLDGLLITERTKNMIENLFAERRDQFKSHPIIQSGLKLVDENDQKTHILEYIHLCEPERILDDFQYDPHYEANEETYIKLSKIKFNDTGHSQHPFNLSQQQNQQLDNSTTDLNLSSSGSSVGEKEN
ncbi:unnamed protein product [Rotaria sp. Silwood2]|nr:unnamed protein product [Rotaria sp. Silwood2]CAF3366444.1 unnamed protein product [Rotaria sp. Silwood2]CAF4506412.1 unnamed protein product [Rotaria sp. Silwood2]CAF4512767.1 unnamed protein product [Rotaria sp. Silwood2]